MGRQRGGGLPTANEMVIQQNYDCSPKPRSLAANGSTEPNKHHFAAAVVSTAHDEAEGKASSSQRQLLHHANAPRSQQPRLGPDQEQQQPLISAKKVIAKSVRSSQNKKFQLPASNRESDGRRGELDGHDCDEVRGKFLTKPSGPFALQQQQKHGRRSQEGAHHNEREDDGDYQERKMELMVGQGSSKSGGGQLAFSSTDSKAAKKKIDIKNLINQSKIKRLQNNLKQGKQAPQQPRAANSRIRLNLEKKSDDCANDFKSEDQAASPSANNVFGRFSAAHKDVTSQGSHPHRPLYGHDNDRFSNQTTNNPSTQARDGAPSDQVLLLQTKLEVALLEKEQAL